MRGASALLDRHSGFEWLCHGAAGIALAVLALQLTSLGSLRWASPEDPALAALRFPVASADWLESRRPAGPLYHTMGDGGYLIWRLHPETAVMLDGRVEVFGERLFANLILPNSGAPAHFESLDAQYHFGVALITYRFFRSLEMLTWLHRNPDWRLVQADEVAALFVRRRPGEAQRPDLGCDNPALGSPKQRVSPAHDLKRREMRVSILIGLGCHGKARVLLENTLSRYPNADLDAPATLLRAESPPQAARR